MGYPTYPNLTKYVREVNTYRTFFGRDKLSINSPKDRKEIKHLLRSDLSPENLSCDGELSGAELRRKHQYLHAVALELYAREQV